MRIILTPAGVPVGKAEATTEVTEEAVDLATPSA